MEPCELRQDNDHALRGGCCFLQDHRQHGIALDADSCDSPSDPGNGGAIYFMGLEMTPEERAAFVSDVAAAIASSVNIPVLSQDELRWVRMAIQREAQSVELRKAIIEKSLAGLVWAAIVFLGYVMLDYLKSHGWKQ